MTSQKVITLFLLIIAVVVVTSASLKGNNAFDPELMDTTLEMGNEAEACKFVKTKTTPPTVERTFIMVKPDGVQRGLIGEIVHRFEMRGYKMVASKMIQVTEEFAGIHYDDDKEMPFFPALIKFISSGPVFPMVWEGVDIVKQASTMVGEHVSAKYNPGSIRGHYSTGDNFHNVVHRSDSMESAKKEISLWFKEEELMNYTLYIHRFYDVYNFLV